MMVRMGRLFLVTAVLVVAVASCASSGSGSGLRLGSGADSKAQTLCGTQRADVAGGTYVVQNNRYGTTAPECVRLDGSTGFRISQSAIDMPADGGPGAYPSIYQGCHWGHCGSGGLAAHPIRVRDLTPGRVTTNWSTVQPTGGTYNVAYDIWFNKTPKASGQPDCTELMVWLNHTGDIEPFGSPIAADVSVGGHTYDVWGGPQRWGRTITYLMTTPVTSVTRLDVGVLAQNAAQRGYLPESCYLIDVEAGFELWQGGTGLGTTSFAVRLPG
jgi:Glycosyl hydrolase family 12